MWATSRASNLASCQLTAPPRRACSTAPPVLDLGGRRIQDFAFRSSSCRSRRVLVGEYVSHLVYGAETAMWEVFDVEGKDGRSLDRSTWRPRRPRLLRPEDTWERPDYQALISNDVSEPIPGSPMALAKLDCLMAINTQLGMSPVTALPTSRRVVLPVPERWRWQGAARLGSVSLARGKSVLRTLWPAPASDDDQVGRSRDASALPRGEVVSARVRIVVGQRRFRCQERAPSTKQDFVLSDGLPPPARPPGGPGRR